MQSLASKVSGEVNLSSRCVLYDHKVPRGLKWPANTIIYIAPIQIQSLLLLTTWETYSPDDLVDALDKSPEDSPTITVRKSTHP
jgi:hypothetical protein